jgi:hypothetical protein
MISVKGKSNEAKMSIIRFVVVTVAIKFVAVIFT